MSLSLHAQSAPTVRKGGVFPDIPALSRLMLLLVLHPLPAGLSQAAVLSKGLQSDLVHVHLPTKAGVRAADVEFRVTHVLRTPVILVLSPHGRH